MITEDYVSFEIAKLLKEKGFNEPCHALYHDGEDKIFFGLDVDSYYNSILNMDCYTCPTLQMVMKWLREVHHITIGITFSLHIITYEIQKDEKDITAIGSSRSYEDMVEEAIKYCLEKLV